MVSKWLQNQTGETSVSKFKAGHRPRTSCFTLELYKFIKDNRFPGSISITSMYTEPVPQIQMLSSSHLYGINTLWKIYTLMFEWAIALIKISVLEHRTKWILYQQLLAHFRQKPKRAAKTEKALTETEERKVNYSL